MHYVYLAYCKNGTLYVGCTKDVNQRIAQHNAGRGGQYTKRNRPLILVAVWSFEYLREARQLERSLKKKPHEVKLLLAKRTSSLQVEIDV